VNANTYASWGLHEAAQVYEEPLPWLEEGGLSGVSPRSLAHSRNEGPEVHASPNIEFLLLSDQ